MNRIEISNSIPNPFLLLFLFFAIGCGVEEETIKEEVIRPVKYMSISTTDVSDMHTFSGTSQAKEESNLSFRVAGKVNKIYVKVGQKVKKGALIAALDAADYNIQLQQAVSQQQGSAANQQSSATQIKSAEGNFIAARSAYNRIEKLYENNSVSLSEFEQAKANYEAAQASFKAAESQYDATKSQTQTSTQSIQNARNQVAYTRLTAPFSGVITSINVEANELVGSGTTIVNLSSIGKPEIKVGVPELLISKVKPGMMAEVVFSVLPEKSFQAKVNEVGYSAMNGSTYPVTVDLLSFDEIIRPGMPADVTFSFEVPTGDAQKVIVTSSAVGEDSKGRFVLTIVEIGENQGTIKKQYVKIGKLRNNGFEILEGLQNDMKIATAGLNTLLEGDKVRLK